MKQLEVPHSQPGAASPTPSAKPGALGLVTPAPKAGSQRFEPGFAAKLNLAVDLLLVVCVSVVSSWLAAGGIGVDAGLWILAGVAAGTWLMVGTVLCLYNPGFADRTPMDDIALLSILLVITMVVVFVVRPLMPEGSALPALSFFAPLLWPPVVLLRLFAFRRLSVQERPADEVLIVGVGPMGRLTGEDMAARGRHRPVGYVLYSNEKPPAELKAPVLGKVDELERLLCELAVEEVYISGKSSTHGPQMQAAVKLCERLGIPFALPAYPFRLDRARPVALQAVLDGYLHFSVFTPKPHQVATKRMLDIGLSSLALAVLSPLFLVLALAIKLTSRGPVFSREQRIGRYCKPFNLLRFRSMVANAEALEAKPAEHPERGGPGFKRRSDPRLTRVGRFLRRYSIDELPQLFNVLRGEMSLVGPRPPEPGEVAQYAAWQRRRLSVPPGFTYLWQLSGRPQLSFEEWMYMDVQ